jgi:hypothetical protein
MQNGRVNEDGEGCTRVSGENVICMDHGHQNMPFRIRTRSLPEPVLHRLKAVSSTAQHRLEPENHPVI